MVNLQAVQAHNATLKSKTSGLVAVFVGGTSGIGLSTARAFARHTTSPKIYLIGRNQQAAEDAITDLKAINSSTEASFIKGDVSLLKSVDSICSEIKAKETEINLLFMTAGYLTLKGRDESAEGLDRKFACHYYSRMRFLSNLQPLLTAAAEKSHLSRVVSVMDPMVAVRLGASGKLDYNDLDLKRGFSLGACGAHASLMNNFYLEAMASRFPGTSYIHAYPSGVDTNVLREFGIPGWAKSCLNIALSFFMVPLVESGERHLYAATSERFPPRAASQQSSQDVGTGSAGEPSSGSYLLSWDGEVFPFNKKIARRRAEGAVDKVVQHTEEVFKQICDEGRRYNE